MFYPWLLFWSGHGAHSCPVWPWLLLSQGSLLVQLSLVSENKTMPQGGVPYFLNLFFWRCCDCLSVSQVQVSFSQSSAHVCGPALTGSSAPGGWLGLLLCLVHLLMKTLYSSRLPAAQGCNLAPVGVIFLICSPLFDLEIQISYSRIFIHYTFDSLQFCSFSNWAHWLYMHWISVLSDLWINFPLTLLIAFFCPKYFACL